MRRPGMSEKRKREAEIQVTAPSGVTWTRRPGATSTGPELLQALADLPRLYDEDRENLRLRLLRTESDAAFFAHVLEAPASSAQREDAERRLGERRAAADESRRQLGNPEQVIDRGGYLPAERREMNLRSHMD